MRADHAVDVVIAVHSATRPVERAVRSALAGSEGLVRVTVVCHDVGVTTIEERLDLDPAERDRVRLLGYQDHVRSPAGPFNHGLDNTSAAFVAVLGSDDVLEPGAVRAWFDVARERGSDVVLAPLRGPDGKPLRNPLVRAGTGRPGRRAATPLDPVADRLAYRSAPLGLLRRATVDRLGLRFTEGLATGEDLAFSVPLWFSGARIDMVPSGPAYVVGGGADDRVTEVVRPVADELAALDDLLVRVLREGGLADRVRPSERRALAVKVLRIHVLGALSRRPRREDWRDGDASVLRGAARAWLDLSPAALHAFARGDRDALDVLTGIGPVGRAEDADDGALADAFAAAARRRARAGRVATLLPRDLPDVLDPESTLRRYVRYRMAW